MITPFQFVLWNSLYFLLSLHFAGYSPFYICLFLFSFVLLSPFSTYLSILSNFLVHFSRLAWRLLLPAFFGHSVYFFAAYFHLKPSLHKLELEQFPAVDKALALPVLLLCVLIKKNPKYWELLFNYNLNNLISRSKRVLQIICSRGLTSTSPREPLV